MRLIKLTYKSIFAYETILYDDIIYILPKITTCPQAVGESQSNISFAEIPNAREIFQLSHSRAKYASFGVATFKIVQVSQKG